MKLFRNTISTLRKGQWGVAVIALLAMLTVGLLPQLANAQSVPTTTFDSPLPDGRDEQKPRGEENEVHELLNELIDHDALLAETLGLTVDELAAARESGTRLDELVDSLGLDLTTVQETLEAARRAAIEQAVTDGLLTDEQADLINNAPTPPASPGERANGPRRAGPGNRPTDPTTMDEEITDDPTTSETTTTGETTTGEDELRIRPPRNGNGPIDGEALSEDGINRPIGNGAGRRGGR